MTIKKLQEDVHNLAVEKGWYETSRTPLEIHALIMSEVAEAVEQVRKGNWPLYFVNTETGQKPEGEAVELADAIIRILDYAEYRGWDMSEIIRLKHEYNKTRPYRHGNKKY